MVSFLHIAFCNGRFVIAWSSIGIGEKTIWTFEHWADLIAQNFETQCFVPDVDAPMVNKKCIYKDTVGASKPWADFQLRCNFPVAMVAVCIRNFVDSISYSLDNLLCRHRKCSTQNTHGKRWIRPNDTC